MATIVLQTVGAAVGNFLGGPIGAAVGQTLGAIGGSYIDRQLFGPGDRSISGPRLESTQLLSSQEGNVVAKVYGRARVAGEIIWATRFEEVQSTETSSQGGKGGGPKTSVATYSYYANFAIGLCEGEIGGIGRIWVDGNLIDQNKVVARLHRGTTDQLPDGLIEAKQGAGKAPAYCGIAYMVFEGFALEDYGNRIPQIAVEVIRPIGQVEKHIHAVNMIPGATEFGYDTQPVSEQVSLVENKSLNVHQKSADTDFIASLDALQAACPNLKQVALVVAWFGTDLRAGDCEIKPGVETPTRLLTLGEAWRVGDIGRANAHQISSHNGSLAYGGTPGDGSVLRAIAELKNRGLKVCLNPFVMMDIPANNTLPDPYGDVRQATYPWRGRITVHPERSQSTTTDGTVEALNQIDSFVGQASVNDIVSSEGSIFHGAIPEWSYRRMILHYARLAELAGGVDVFLLGSELRGLTSVRDASEQFPFVDALTDLASDITPILGPGCLLTYGADWSEYFGFQPDDGSNNVYYNLDALWASPHIGAVGIDNYMPISDWRDGDKTPDGRSPYDPTMLSAHVAGGEGYDWYYASEADRDAKVRTPITDGLGKPWVYRYKDLVSWWSNPHYDRSNGVETSTPSNWVPQGKPIIFTEFGCPAIHNGPVQPNVFYDPKSSESAFPYFSKGGRDDVGQVAYLSAMQAHWDTGHSNFDQTNNPVSSVYGAEMVDFNRSQLWAWDARPYPWFPDLEEVWSDAENWTRGHWLNGRLASVQLADLISHLLLENGIFEFNVDQVNGSIDGYVIADASSARQAMEILVSLYRLSVWEDAGVVYFRSRGKDPARYLSVDDLVFEDDEPIQTFTREQENELPVVAKIGHIDPTTDYQVSESAVSRNNGNGNRQQRLSAPIVLSASRMKPVLEGWLHERWTGRNTVSLGVSRSASDLTVGDDFVLEQDDFAQRWKISSIEDGEFRKLSARAVEVGTSELVVADENSNRHATTGFFSAPYVQFLNLPYFGSNETVDSNRIAAAASPWPGPLAVYSSSSQDAYAYRQTISNAASLGILEDALPGATTTSRWDYSGKLTVRLLSGSLSSLTKVQVMNGANALAVKSSGGAWEVLQFERATLIDNQIWELSGLLRGQAGTELEASAGSEAGAEFVILNQAVVPLEISSSERGLTLNWMVGPVGGILGDPEFRQAEYTTGYRGLQTYSPVHLHGLVAVSGDLSLNWVRRDRLNADDWVPGDIPLSEVAEIYRVTLTDQSGASLGKDFFAPEAAFSALELTTAFGASPQTIDVSVAQVSAALGPGSASKIEITI